MPVAVDVNGDGHLDLLGIAPVGSYLRRIAWLPGDGAGGFLPRIEINVGPDSGYTFDVADLDADGDLDIAFTRSFPSRFSWIANDGVGGFAVERLIAASEVQLFLRVLDDLDGDGAVDAIVESSSNVVQHLYPSTGLGFEPFGPPRDVHRTAYLAVGPAVADVDGDGDQDVLSASTSSGLAWYPNLGSGTFGPQRIASTGLDSPGDVRVADFDGDGRLDLAARSFYDGQIQIVPGTAVGSSVFGDPFVVDDVSPAFAGGLVVEDVDRDGDPDLVVVANVPSSAFWLENLGTTFGPRRRIVSLPEEIGDFELADLDADGFPDLVIQVGGADPVRWIPSTGGGDYGAPVVLAASDGPLGDLDLVDLDADGDVDIVWSVDPGGDLVWVETTAPGVFAQPATLASLGTVTQRGTFFDVDADGDLDYVASSDFSIVWSENLGLGPQGAPNFDAFRSIEGFASLWSTPLGADLDGDGDQELILAEPNEGLMTVFDNLTF